MPSSGAGGGQQPKCPPPLPQPRRGSEEGDADTARRGESRPEPATPAGDVERKLDGLAESMSRKLERIALALGVRNLNAVDNGGDDAEDRKRLMEKLKSAFDNDRRSRLGATGTERERWLEYVFGICKPDQRIGKRGSRCCALLPIHRVLFCRRCDLATASEALSAGSFTPDLALQKVDDLGLFFLFYRKAEQETNHVLIIEIPVLYINLYFTPTSSVAANF